MRLIAAFALTLLAFAPARAVEVREIHYVMGTLVGVEVDAPDRSAGQRVIREAIAVARALDRELTTFDAGSALSRLNEGAGGSPSAVPPDLFHILELSRVLWRETSGTFDPSVGPALALWKEAARRGSPPSLDSLARARASTGFDKVHFVAPDRIALERSGMSLDLGGIGKGYAVDRMIERLRALGVESALVDFGESSFGALGPPADEPPFRIWLRSGAGLLGPVELRDEGLSTSGSLARAQRIGRKRFGDLIDPRTGRALASNAQATIAAPTAVAAEAWSKALLIDPAASLATIEARPDLDGLLVQGDRIRATRRFRAIAPRDPRS